MIEVKNLSFHYPKCKTEVLHNLSFFCTPGSVNLFLGLNGSGKTTLIKLLAGLYVPNNGQVYYDSVPLETLSATERSKRIAYVSQRSGTIDDFSVRDYLLFGTLNQTKFYQTPSDVQVERVQSVAERMNISYLLDKSLGEISGGERQKVSIASAIIQDTPFLLLDEPTSALDICNQNMVLSVLKNIADEEKKTILLSSHNPNHALYLNANVIFLKDREIIDAGAASDVVTKGRLMAIYGDRICYSNELKYREISFR